MATSKKVKLVSEKHMIVGDAIVQPGTEFELEKDHADALIAGGHAETVEASKDGSKSGQ